MLKNTSIAYILYLQLNRSSVQNNSAWYFGIISLVIEPEIKSYLASWASEGGHVGLSLDFEI